MGVKSNLSHDPDIAELIQFFLDELTKRYAMIEEAESESQWDEVYYTVHQIKGSGTSYGFPQLTALSHTVTEHLLELARQLAQLLQEDCKYRSPAPANDPEVSSANSAHSGKSGNSGNSVTSEIALLLETPNRHRLMKFLCERPDYRNRLDELVIESSLPKELDALLNHIRDILATDE